jgi:hypothetical protein
VARFAGEQRGLLDRHRAEHARDTAQAKAAEQRAELEAADVLQQRLALPFGQSATTADVLHSRIDKVDGRLSDAAGVVRQLEQTNAALARQLGTLSSRVDAFRDRPTHTDQPLIPRKELDR